MDEMDDITLLEYIQGRLSREEEERVVAWLDLSPGNRSRYERILEGHRLASWGMLQSQIRGSFPAIERRIRRRRILRTASRYAAVILICIMGGIGLRLYWTPRGEVPGSTADGTIVPGNSRAFLELSSGKVISLSDQSRQLQEKDGSSIKVAKDGKIAYSRAEDGAGDSLEIYNRLSVPRGGEFSVILADGSRVYLNSATEFRYPACFNGRERKVFLKGEAYFEVSKDRKHPFIVVMDSCSVKVYGTTFNINTRKKGRIETVLVSGKVSFVRGQEEYSLHPGELAEYRGKEGCVSIRQVDVSNYIAWKNGNFIFENEFLGDIMSTLSLWYDMDVRYSSNAVKDVRLSGALERFDDIRELLYFFEKISDLRFDINGKEIYVRKKR